MRSWARQSVAFGYHWVHRDLGHHGWEGDLRAETWSLEKGQMRAKKRPPIVSPGLSSSSHLLFLLPS